MILDYFQLYFAQTFHHDPVIDPLPFKLLQLSKPLTFIQSRLTFKHNSSSWNSKPWQKETVHQEFSAQI